MNIRDIALLVLRWWRSKPEPQRAPRKRNLRFPMATIITCPNEACGHAVAWAKRDIYGDETPTSGAWSGIKPGSAFDCPRCGTPYMRRIGVGTGAMQLHTTEGWK